MEIKTTCTCDFESGSDIGFTVGVISLGLIGLMAVSKHDAEIKGACKEAHEVERISKNGIPSFMSEVDKKSLSLDSEDKIEEYAETYVKKATKFSPDGKVFMFEYYRFKAEMIQATRGCRCITLDNLKSGMPFISPVELFDKMYQWHLIEHINYSKSSALFCEDVSEQRSSVLRLATEEFKQLNDAICAVLFEDGDTEKRAQEAFKNCTHVPVLKELKPYKCDTAEESFITRGTDIVQKQWVRDAQLRSSANQIYDDIFADLTKMDGGLVEIVNEECFNVLINTMITDSAELLNKFKDIKEYAIEQINKK